MKRRWFRRKKALSIGSFPAAFTDDRESLEGAENRKGEIMKYLSQRQFLPKLIPEENGAPSHMTFDTSTFRSSKKMFKADRSAFNIPTNHDFSERFTARKSMSMGLLTSGSEESLDAKINENVTVVKMYTQTSHFGPPRKPASRTLSSGDMNSSSDKSHVSGVKLNAQPNEARAVVQSDQKQVDRIKDLVNLRDSRMGLKRDHCLDSQGMKVNTLPHRNGYLKRSMKLVDGNHTKVSQRCHSLSHIPPLKQNSLPRNNFSTREMSSPLPSVQSKHHKVVNRGPQKSIDGSPRPSSFMVMHYKRLGVLNLLKHRLDLLEDKLGCRQNWSVTIDVGRTGESSSDPPEKKRTVAIGSLSELSDEDSRSISGESIIMERMNSFSSASSGRTEGGAEEFVDGVEVLNVLVKVRVDTVDVQKRMCFPLHQRIWEAKLQVLNSFGSKVQDGLNYGFFILPANNRAGKFLDDERSFKDYHLDSKVGLEFKYKKRVYRQMNLDFSQVRKNNSKANLRSLLDAIKNRDTAKVEKLLVDKSIDPNFIAESAGGESPLTLAASLDKTEEVIKLLVGNGAHLDFRNKQGQTAVHKAVEKSRAKIAELILDLGASSNYRDAKGLTPAYYSVLYGGDPTCLTLMVKDRSDIDISDEKGWSELHQACKYGRIQHLEILLSYGADMNAQNEAGNTALHICASHNQTAAARILLFRGADKLMLNQASQSAHQVAIMSNNLDLAENIKNFGDDQVVRIQEAPVYAPRRRWTNAAPLSRTSSEPFIARDSDLISLKSGTSANSMPVHRMDSGSGGYPSPMMHRRVNKPPPLKEYVAIQDYTASDDGELSFYKGDIIDILSIAGDNYWEGCVNGRIGWFPSHFVRETGNKKKSTDPGMTNNRNLPGTALTDKHSVLFEPRVAVLQRGKKGFGFVLRGAKSPKGPQVEFTPTKEFPALQYLECVDKGSPADKAGLLRGDFVLEVWSASYLCLVQLVGQAVVQSKGLPLPAFGKVAKNWEYTLVSWNGTLNEGHMTIVGAIDPFHLQINGEDVTSAPHQQVVHMVVTAPDTIVMKVVTAPNALSRQNLDRLAAKHPKKLSRLTQRAMSSYESDTWSVCSSLGELDDRESMIRPEVEIISIVSSSSDGMDERDANMDRASISSFFEEEGPPASSPSYTPVMTRNQLQTNSQDGYPYSNDPGTWQMTLPSNGSSKIQRPTMPPPEPNKFSTIARITSAKKDTLSQDRSTAFDEEIADRTLTEDDLRRYSIGSDSAVSSSRSSPASSYKAPSNGSGTDSAVNMLYERSTSEPVVPKPKRPMPPPPARSSSLSLNGPPTIAPVEEAESELPKTGLAAAIAQKAAQMSKKSTVTQEAEQSPSSAFQLAIQERDKALKKMTSEERLRPPPPKPKPGPSVLEDAIQKRKAKLEEKKDHSDIESKIKSYKQEARSRPKGEDALLNALSKRRSKVDGENGDGEDESSVSPLPSPVRKAPLPPPKTVSAMSPVNDGSNKIMKPSNKPPPPPPTTDKPSVPRPKVRTSPPSAVNSEQSKVNSLERDGIVPPPAIYSDRSIERSKNTNRDHLVETASVSSSQSSISTVSTMSTDPSSNDSFESGPDKQDNYDSNNSVQSSSSSTSSSVVTVKSVSDHENGNMHLSSSSQQDLNQINDQNNTSSKPVAEWTIEEVADWLVAINMSDYRNDFIENEIAGEHLVALTKDDLGELGVKRLGHKMTILKAVQKLS